MLVFSPPPFSPHIAETTGARARACVRAPCFSFWLARANPAAAALPSLVSLNNHAARRCRLARATHTRARASATGDIMMRFCAKKKRRGFAVFACAQLGPPFSPLPTTHLSFPLYTPQHTPQKTYLFGTAAAAARQIPHKKKQLTKHTTLACFAFFCENMRRAPAAARAG